MLDGAFLHLPGVGPKRYQRLEEARIRDWDDLEQRLPDLGFGPGIRGGIKAALDQCRRARDEQDIDYLVRTLHPSDHWRILGTFLDDTSYFDIETSGLEADSLITVIACHHRGQVQTFVRDQNLDDFLDLLDDVRLLVSFNGTSFDVPRVESGFHIPSIPCPHLDLRWICYHRQLRGGLKQIERALDIRRADDLQGVDGAEAVWLWNLWESRGNAKALDRLLRYCAADVTGLPLVAARLLEQHQRGPVTTPGSDPSRDGPDRPPSKPAAIEPPPRIDTTAHQRLERHWQQRQRRR